MKKTLLFVLMCLCATMSAWATATVVTSDGVMTITSTEKGSLRDYANSNSFTADDKAATTVILIGEFEPADLDAIKANGSDFNFTTVDMSQALFPKPQGSNQQYKLYNTQLPDIVYDETKYVLGATVYQYTNGAWGQVTSYTDGTEAKYYLADETEQKPSANNNEYLAVGGSVYKMIHDWNANPQTHTWVDAGGVEYDWKAIKFNNWASSIETAILPDGVLANDLDQNDLWPDPNNSKITRVESGSTYAVLTKVNNQNTAEIFASSDEEFDRMKDILTRDNLVSASNIERGSTSGDYIHYDAQTGIAEVHVTEPGSFTRLFPKNTYADGTIFRFDSDCVNFTAADLAMMATDPGKYYVDLYDVTTSNDVETAIADAISSMRTSNKQYKGLLLPKNPTTIGTTLIQDEQQGNGAKATCSEFIAYNNQTVTMAHIYSDNPANPNPTYEQSLTKLKAIMDAHVNDQGNNVIENATSIYAVSTNKRTEITNVNDIKGTDAATVIHIYNNEMVGVATEPSMVVTPRTGGGGDFAQAVELTSIEYTANLDKVKFYAPVTSDDILAVNQFTSGPKVLDLSAIPASQITRGLLNSLTNTVIEYIILPAGMDEPVVGDYANLTNLKCVISSNKSGDTEHVLNAYVKVAGSLTKARCLATGHKPNNELQPTVQGLTSVKLGGNLNLNDIKTDADGYGLSGEYATITSLDLSNAYFANVNDMRLGNSGQALVNGQPVMLDGAGFFKSTVLTEVKLPTTMTEIPAQCLYGIRSLHNLHIPYNYEKIGWEAFWETNIDHITTEDANHAVIDNGPKTYTLSAAIAELGEAGHEEGHAVFPDAQSITDVYCLAMTTPICYAHTFHANIVYGNGGMNEGVYCREKYHNGNDVIAVLHFPSQESYKNATGSENGYADMVSLYTDPTRVYSKKDQTGAVDANGNPLLWPDQQELLQSRIMALNGHIWADYPNKVYGTGDGCLKDLGECTGGPHNANGEFFPQYVGWHEFVLSMATYVDPEEIIEDEKIVREYVETDWYTFCIPFDMTISQVQEMLGVPASTDKVICKLNGQEVTTAIMPDIRQLDKVTREKGQGTASNHVRLYLTNNLWNGTKAQYLDFGTGDDNGQKAVDAATEAKTDRCLVGGRPYVIKAYRRAGDEYKIKGQNLGKYIMTRYGDEFGKAASCVENGLYEQLYNGAGEGKVTLRFAIPYENHKVRAVKYGGDATYLEYKVNVDGTPTAYHYNYTLVGQYWQQPLPLYSFYMSKGKWYRYTGKTDTNGNRYTWDPYKCIIMATPEIDDTEDHPMSGKYRDNDKSVYPTVVSGTDDLLKENFSLAFLNGRDDDDFDNQPASYAKYIFSFNDGIEEYGDDGSEVTAIKMIDGEELNYIPENGNVYNMAGQFVGKGLAGLPKGLYVVNGKKYIVK